MHGASTQLDQRKAPSQRLLMVCLIFGMAAVLYVGILFRQQSVDAIAYSEAIVRKELILAQIETLFSLIKDAETGQRGFLLSGKNSYLEPYSKAASGIPSAVARLQQALSDEPAQAKLLQSLLATINAKLTELKLTVDIYKSGKPADAVSHLNDDTGLQLMDKIRSGFTELAAQERSVLSDATAELSARTRAMALTFSWLAGLSIALFAAFAYLMRTYAAASRALKHSELLLQDRVDKLEAQKELIQAQKEQAELLDLTHDMILVRDLDGVISYWNRGAQETYGFTKEQAIGTSVFELLQTEFPEPKENIEKELAEKHRWDGELIHIAQDKSRLNIASRWALKLDANGRANSVLEINSDVTAQRQSEAALLAALKNRDEQWLQTVVDSAPNGMLMVDPTGAIQLVNSHVEYLFDYDRSELLGRTIEILVPEQFRNAFREHRSTLFDAFTPSKPGAAIDLYARRKDGSQFPVQIELNPVRYDGEDFVLASVVDMTERKRAEELLQQKMVELGRSNDELQQFAYVCSHDLQEPLRVISNYTQLLARRYKGQLDEKADQFIDFTVDASKRMQNLINDLLHFSRLQTKAKPFRPVDCTKTVETAIENLKLAIAETGATINYDTLPTVPGDPTQLLQLFQNLIGNGIKFHSQEKPIIDISAHVNETGWLFSVRDNGIGLDMQFAERIFVIFQRLHVKEEYSGSGIGLAVCKKIVERHGGRISVESSPGAGCTFRFTIQDTPLQKEYSNQENESIAR